MFPIIRKLPLFLFFFSLLINGQNKRLDSLLKLSKTSKDTLKIKVLNEISWEYKNSNLDTALLYAKVALDKAKEIQHKKSISESYNSIGSVFEAKSKTDSALYYHKKSLAINIELKDSIGIADSYNNLGIILDEQGNYLEALRNYFNALKIYEKKSEKFDQVPAVLVNIGIVYKKQKKFNKVLEYYKRALKIYEKNNFKIGIVIVTGNIGSVQLKLGNYKKAIDFCKKARKMYSDLGYKRYLPYMDVNIAGATYYLKNYNKSIQIYKEVIKSFTDDNNLYELSNAKIGISKPYLATKQFQKANTSLKSALQISKKNKYKEFEADALENLAVINFKLKNYKRAYTYKQEYHTKKDSLFEKEKVKHINEILVKYETSKKEKEIAQQKEQLLEKELAIKNKNFYTLVLGFTLLIVGIVFFTIYKRNQLRRKQLQKEIDLKDALATIKTQNRLQEQRLRISRDLHDNIGSQLTFIISSLDNLKYISKDVNLKVKSKLSEISSFTSETIHELRDTIWAMNKSEISIEDLHTRILSFVEKAKTATENINFEVNYTIDKNLTLSSLTGMNIFRVLQESLNNAIKYADASLIEVKINQRDKKLIIQVVDNGIGFDLKNVNLGSGLMNMEKRMSEIKGEININSIPNKGTTISIVLEIK